MDEDKKAFAEIQKEIDIKKKELNTLKKRMRPIVKNIKKFMSDNDKESLKVDGYVIKRKKHKSVSFTEDKVKDYAPDLDWGTYEETYEKEREVLKVEKAS